MIRERVDIEVEIYRVNRMSLVRLFREGSYFRKDKELIGKLRVKREYY